MSIILTGNDLTLEELSRIVYEKEKIELHPDSIKKIIKCRDYVEKIVEEELLTLWEQQREIETE